uniref:Uncharacterized protein n=1 Tax=Strix occidentalis caurina TaxID=311401 RepID=A0A8D0FDF7_STROC
GGGPRREAGGAVLPRGARPAGRQQRGAEVADGGRALSGQSYWLDLWLFVLFDLALFVVIYLLP